jgi:hypothetical protein
MLLIRAQLNDKAYFRALKTRFSELSDWEKTAGNVGCVLLA